MRSNKNFVLSIAIYFLVIIFFSIYSVNGQVSVTKTELHGREAFRLENDRIQVSMLTGGGYIGEVRLKSRDANKAINPMRVPHYRTIDPQDYNPEKHDIPYGGKGDRKVMASYMGHFLCFPYFGGMNSQFERDIGYGAHGEAAVVKWDIEGTQPQNNKASIVASANLPLSSYRVNRRLTMASKQMVVLVEEEVENIETFDRPYQWVQHVTFGDPFIAYNKTFVDAPVSKFTFDGKEGNPNSDNTVEWPMVKMMDGTTFDVGIFSMNTGEGDYRAWLLDPNRTHSWFTVYNSDYNVLIGYIFPKDDNPWIGDWQENGFKKHMPWDGKAVARGILIGTSPFTSGVKRSIERGPIFDTKTYGWIGAKEMKKQSYLIFITEIKDGYKGVSKLSAEEGVIIITEKETAKQKKLVHGFSL